MHPRNWVKRSVCNCKKYTIKKPAAVNQWAPGYNIPEFLKVILPFSAGTMLLFLGFPVRMK
jgi:hypothetical protein